ncbi:MAG TPA: TetR/AcrR family transcriptional regulator [Gemmatimonadaceae bacterium]|nr:TetR/AcrR family transcriptional regulator [Gemmatimonadaceae bacterium]
MPNPKRPARSAASPRPYHHGNLRRALLDEALVTIAAEGVDAVTLREIGARVGVSRTALYRHFADKRALLAAVATEGFRTLRERLVGSREDGNRRGGGFGAMGVAYVQFALDNPSHYRVMFGPFVDREFQDPELATEAHGAFQALVDALVAQQEAGNVRRDDPLQMASYVWAVVHGLAMLAIDGKLPEPVNIDVLTQYALDRLLTGIAR